MIAPRCRSPAVPSASAAARRAQPRLVAGPVGAECRDQPVAGGLMRHRKGRAEPPTQCGLAAGEREAQLAAFGGDFGHQLGETLLRSVAGDDRQRLGQRGRFPRCSTVPGACRVDHGFDRFRERLAGAAFVEHDEFRRHAGFEREAAQQRLAECVDRQDLGAARDVEDARKQLTGKGDIVFGGVAAGQLDQLWRQRARRHCRPLGQPCR